MARTRKETREELENPVMDRRRGDRKKGKIEAVDPLLAALEEEYGPGGINSELEEEIDKYDEDGCKITPKGNKIPYNSGQKIVFRGLPPRITEEEFLEITGIDPSEFNYFFINYPNPFRLINSESRAIAHVNFVDFDMAEIYLEKFDDFVFIDKSGRDYVCTTSRSGDQRIPRFKHPKDPLEGTVFESEDFTKFKMLLEAEAPLFGVEPEYEDGAEMCDVFLEELEERERNPPKFASCPLVEFFKNKNKKEKEFVTQDDKMEKTSGAAIRSRNRKNRRRNRNTVTLTHSLAVPNTHDTFDAIVLEAANENAKEDAKPKEIAPEVVKPSSTKSFEESFPQLSLASGIPENEPTTPTQIHPSPSWSSLTWTNSAYANANWNGNSVAKLGKGKATKPAEEKPVAVKPTPTPRVRNQKGRPDKQIYRPGGFKKSAAAAANEPELKKGGKSSAKK